MTYSTIAGMFFLRDNGDSYITGEIISQIHQDVYLLKPDNMNGLPAPLPHELMSLGDMTMATNDGIPVISLFPNREEMDAWIKWIDTPSEPRVINLVKK